ncbi:MAG TPA: tRNA epoxyqueuosine(34) reductase QueG [Geminicoccaceae bacterium]|nr:tRNA epoxyqueuosine(34) reductase QueG [Geminicoccus sp.]HMU50725.1 tRNA epoxyqueuosine(34) reductase QueG [Geminicoccaceae bacterium]
MPADPREAIRARGRELGFDEVRFARAELPAIVGRRYREALAEGRHGEMDWLARDPDRRAAPRGMWPEARSAIVCAVNYGPDTDPMASLAQPTVGTVSVYARNRDYHELLKGRLKQLAGWMHGKLGADVKVFVDTAPLLEKPLAEAAGLGWQGKHTNLVSRRFGSWLFLGEILTVLDLEPDAAEVDHCGQCRRCLDACPTDAFPAPYRLDARRCISYLTIEHAGPIPAEFREAIGNRVYGCDDCLAACPWNKFARACREAKLQARADLEAPPLAELAALDDAGFRARFAGSPIKRIGRDRFVRNVLIAIGNSGNAGLASSAERLLADPSPLVRGMAVWALRRLLGPAAAMACRRTDEPDAGVRAEWRAAA